MRTLPLMFALTLSLLAFTSCGSSNKPDSTLRTGTVSGTIIAIESGDPLPHVGLILIDPETLTPASALAHTDSSGNYTIPNVEVGTYWIWFFPQDRFLFYRESDFVTVRRYEVTQADMQLSVPFPPASGFTHEVRGVITDSVTGKPIPGAVVSLVFMQELIELLTQNGAVFFGAVSDQDGVVLFQPPLLRSESGMASLMPLIFSHHAYEPKVLTGDGTPDLDYNLALIEIIPDQDMLEFEITMDPLTKDSSMGSIHGRVLYRDAPVPRIRISANLLVADNLDTLRTTPEPVPIMGKTATTDDNGEFWFENLPPGFYSLEPAFDPDDGYNVGYPQSRVTVEDSSMAEIGDIPVVQDIQIISPPHGSTGVSAQPTFSWEYVEGANNYSIRYGTGDVLDFSYQRIIDAENPPPTSWMPEPGALKSGDRVRWGVQAWASEFDESGDIIGGTELGSSWNYSFTVGNNRQDAP